MKKIVLSAFAAFGSYLSFAQSQITTTGNNVINPANPYAADIVIGSDAGTRHDGSMMWWSSVSASQISNAYDVFYLSIWNTTNPNIGLAAGVGGTSFFKGNVGIGTTNPIEPLEVNGNIIADGLISTRVPSNGNTWFQAATNGTLATGIGSNTSATTNAYGAPANSSFVGNAQVIH